MTTISEQVGTMRCLQNKNRRFMKVIYQIINNNPDARKTWEENHMGHELEDLYQLINSLIPAEVHIACAAMYGEGAVQGG